MARKSHNNVLILGVVFLIAGAVLFIAGGNASTLRFGNSGGFSSEVSGNRVLVIRDSDGEVAGQILSPYSRDRINHNAADDPAFQNLEGGPEEGSLGEFLGLYDFNLMTAFTILFLVAGSLLVIVSNIRFKPKKRYY